MIIDVEISIDSVEGLGDFIELEYKGQSSDVNEARNYLFSILGKMNAETKEIDLKGYPFLLLEKNGLI